MQAMRWPKVIDNLQDIYNHEINSLILLFSGGIDGSYFLEWSKEYNRELIALNIGLCNEPNIRQSQLAQMMEYQFQSKHVIWQS